MSQLTNFQIFRSLKRFFLFLCFAPSLALCLEKGPVLQNGGWVSLYNGNETSLSAYDRARVVDVLSHFALSFYVERNGEIMVPADQKAEVQELLSVGLRFARKNSNIK